MTYFRNLTQYITLPLPTPSGLIYFLPGQKNKTNSSHLRYCQQKRSLRSTKTICLGSVASFPQFPLTSHLRPWNGSVNKEQRDKDFAVRFRERSRREQIVIPLLWNIMRVHSIWMESRIVRRKSLIKLPAAIQRYWHRTNFRREE